MGTIGGGFFAGLIAEAYGWRWSFVVFGGLGVLLYLLLWWLVPRADLPRSAGQRFAAHFPDAPAWIGVGLLLGLVAVASSASAQSLSVPTVTKNAGNTADDFSDGLITSYQNKTTVIVVSSNTSVFRVRYQEIVAADVGFGGSDQTQSQNTDYQINFTATAPGAYRLNISTSRARSG
jgi:MFS family permease